ncbi:MAG: DUF1553 domain-containing protein [Verrucomicrobia bacterium]|nr:DUF1553 domain-containing protein [Verrucomicrobiota bacterium]
MVHSARLTWKTVLSRVLGLLSFGFLIGSSAPAQAAATVDFQKDIRPILSDHCFKCHGPDEAERKGKLRLDTREGALQTASGQVVLVPGNAKASPLWQRLVTSDPDEKMPPAQAKKPLTEAQIAKIQTWIDQGAPYASHWAFSSPTRPPIPSIPDSKPSPHPIDAFVKARLEREKLSMAPEADRTTLLRRLSLDLIGLPPAPFEVGAFNADRSPGAYERQVDRLLKSEHYGERWGRHWLDAARYADSDGFEKDKSRAVWFYRDWVIQSLNRDLPYDAFLVDQIAGDLRPRATQDQIVATGFLRHAMLNEEGGVDPEQFRMDAMFDRMDCIGKSVLGLTIQCAQCHNHKYDPLTQEEYYKLFAFLNNDHEAQRVVYAADELMKIEEIKRSIGEHESRLREAHPNWEEQMAVWERGLKAPDRWTSLSLTNAGDHGQRYLAQADGSILAQGYAPTKFTTHLRGHLTEAHIGSFRIELLNDPNLPCNGPGRSFMGTCALTEFAVEATDLAEPTNKITVRWTKATADYANPERELESNFYDKTDKRRVTGPVSFAIDGKDDTAWGMDAGPGRRNVPRQAVFVPEKPLRFPKGVILDLKLRQNHGGWNSDDHMNNNLGRFRLSFAESTQAEADPLPPRLREVLAKPASERTPAQKLALFSHWRATVPAMAPINEKIEQLWQQWPAGSTTLTFQSRDEPRMTSLLKRGDWLKPLSKVDAGVPAFMHPLRPGSEPARMRFALWLVDRSSPTTARVIVNRVWQTYFGTGLVASPEDFGVQSEAPSHPELLDWLAVEFMDTGWSLKKLHRLIVTSKTYRQHSRVSQELLERDPYNRLLARGARLRVEGEIVRDIALAASGLLNPKIGGPSLFSPAPEFLFQPPASYAPFPWKEETGPDRYRRTVYTFRRRSTPYPSLQIFDTPNGDAACVRRLRSNTPLQALVALNDPVFVECAQALAKTTLDHGGNSDSERVRYAFRRVLSRAPSKDEERELRGLVERQSKRLAEGWISASEIATGKSAPPQGLKGSSPTQWAAYTVLARVLLNLDETMTKE